MAEEQNAVAAPPQPEDAPPLPVDANGDDRDKARSKSRDHARSKSRDHRRSGDGSKSRRRSRSRDRKRKSRSKSRDRKRRSRSRERRRERSREQPRREHERRRSPSHDRRDSKRRSYGDMDRREPFRRREITPPEVRAERQQQAELEALDRDTRTVFAYNLPLRAEEKEIFQFFMKAGPLNDIKVITDKTTGRSKGFAYIEFQRREDVINALALTGQVLMGQAVMVKMSEAEKNLAWEAAEQAKRQQKELEKELGPGALMTAAAPLMPAPLPGMAGVAALAGMMAPAQPMVAAGPARLALSSLPTSIAEDDLRPIFEPFGVLDFLTLQRDMAGRPTGNGFVQYRLLADATKAKENLNGLDIVGHKLGVGWANIETPVEAMAVAPPPPPLPPVVAAMESLDDGGEGAVGGLKLTGQSRAALMSKLAANAGLDVSNVPQLLLPQAAPVQPQVPAALALEQGFLGPASPIPSQCLLLKNMFDPAEETADNWDAEIAEDVGSECQKYGPVEHVFVDRNSRGYVYVKFGAISSAVNAQRALHGRWFAARQIVADFQFTPIYNQHFGV
ncbi:RNA-binding protein 39 [Chlorella vulgaris]